jgi:hypothetical protein
MFFNLIAFYRARCLDGATKQQEFLGKGGFTRIRVRYNGESAPSGYLGLIFHNGRKGTVMRALC